MTNAEKFEEVFGIKIDEYPDTLCDIADHDICVNASDCSHCRLHKFWEKQYRKKRSDQRVYVVSYIAGVGYAMDNYHDEPVVTVFDNKAAAKNCYKQFKKEGKCAVSLDSCRVYKTFKVKEDE